MLNVPHDLYTSEQIRQLENIAINEHNLSASVLMSRAGRAGLDSLKRHWPHTERILILCGTGNNGGDGFSGDSFTLICTLVGFNDVTQLTGANFTDFS